MKGPIVIVEDDTDDQFIIETIFKELRLANKLLFFHNSEAAFNYLMSTSEIPFLILSDVNMPGANGVEFKKKIDQADYLRKKSVPFIFLTTSSSVKAAEEAFTITNLQGYFKKASSIDEMRRIIKLIIEYWSTSFNPGND